MSLHFGTESTQDGAALAADEVEVSITLTPAIVTLSPGAHLGAEAGGLLRELVAAAGCSARPVEIDVGRVSSFTSTGAAELLNCRLAGSSLPGGLRHRASSPLGQRVLLAACRARG